jgi:aminopeptidase N
MRNFLLACLLFFPSLLFSQSYIFIDQPFEKKVSLKSEFKKSNKKILKDESALIKRDYDVLKYTLTLDWRNIFKSKTTEGPDRYYKGINKIDLVIDTIKLNKIELDAVNQLIDSVKSTSFEYQPTYVQSGDLLTINLPSQKLKGDTISFEIYYTYIGKDNSGFNLYPQGKYIGQGPPPKRDSIFLIHRIAYTMSETSFARNWMPCNDQPDDKAYFEVTVLTPPDLPIVAVSNGLGSLQTTTDSRTWHYSSQYPMATYLMQVTASEFEMHQDSYAKVTNPNISIPIFYYVWGEDWTSDTTDGGAYNAENSFQNTSAMMGVYAKLFGEFPFESYGMVAVQPFDFGGMEHQTMTSINRTWLRGWYETGIAHELSHQWIGDLMTCATWYDIWLNEGGATWSEALWVESYAGSSGYDDYLGYTAYSYFRDTSLYQIPIYAVPINGIFTYPLSILTYNKAGFVYNMLRKQIGDSAFFPAFRNILKKFSFKSIETIDFAEALKKEVPNFDFDQFFNQWIFSAGHPILNLSAFSYNWGNNKYKITLDITQKQSGLNIPNVFKTPIRILFFKDSTQQTYRDLYLSNREDTLETFIDFRPDSIAIDQTYLLCQVQETTLGVNDGNIYSNDNITVYPNPIAKGDKANINFHLNNYANLEISLFDELGRKVRDIYSNYLSNGNMQLEVKTDDLQSGIYFIKIQANDGSMLKILKLVVI